MKTIYIGLLLCFCTLIQAQNTAAILEKVDKRLGEIFESANAPGLSFSIVWPDGSTSTIVKGMANVEKQLPMSTDTKMLGGSTGKVFYSVVAMQLIEEGKISLDEPVINRMADYTWFKRLPNASELTVRHLMRHQSGLPRYVFKEAFQADVIKDANKVWKPEELLAYVFDDQPLFEVGKDFAYSDTNYIVLAMLIEKVTGNTLYTEVKQRVLRKAGLKQVVPQDKRKYDNLAQGYNGENDPFFPGKALDDQGQSRYNWQFEWAGGGLVITTHDLALLGKKIYEGKMFNPELLDEYFDGVPAGNLGGHWGLGVHIQERSGGKIYGHSGFMPGYVTNMLYFEKGKFAICYQINTSDQQRTGIFRQLPSVAALLNQELAK